MSMITGCPACGTLFRVVPDQLKISDGWVRCGHCSEVFDATTHLQADAGEGDSLEAARNTEPQPLPETPAVEAPSPAQHVPFDPVPPPTSSASVAAPAFARDDGEDAPSLRLEVTDSEDGWILMTGSR